MSEATRTAAAGALERLRRKRVVDVEAAETLLALGWTQSSGLDGLLWCSVCSQPTVWKDQAGDPKHLSCSELVA